MLRNHLVLIKGAGDLATGVAFRLHRAGFRVAMTEIPRPLAVRRSVAFAQAVYDGEMAIERITAQRSSLDRAASLLDSRIIPVLIDPAPQALAALSPDFLVDAIMAKRNAGTRITDAPLVIALGPGFQAGGDCHVVIETKRGHYLGRALWNGSAETDTGHPGDLPGAAATAARVLRAPCAGHVRNGVEIGTMLRAGAPIATLVDLQGATRPLQAPIDGVLRGLIHPDVRVQEGMKIGDLDPRAEPEYCFTISDKSLAIGGGVLEAVLTALDRDLLP